MLEATKSLFFCDYLVTTNFYRLLQILPRPVASHRHRRYLPRPDAACWNASSLQA